MILQYNPSYIAAKTVTLQDQDAQEKIKKFNCEDLLQFVTGSRYEPPIGFPTHPKLTFLHDKTKFPSAHTCALSLSMPVGLTYQVLAYRLSLALINGTTFSFI